jgi:hypothetical protein
MKKGLQRVVQSYVEGPRFDRILRQLIKDQCAK